MHFEVPKNLLATNQSYLTNCRKFACHRQRNVSVAMRWRENELLQVDSIEMVLHWLHLWWYGSLMLWWRRLRRKRSSQTARAVVRCWRCALSVRIIFISFFIPRSMWMQKASRVIDEKMCKSHLFARFDRQNRTAKLSRRQTCWWHVVRVSILEKMYLDMNRMIALEMQRSIYIPQSPIWAAGVLDKKLSLKFSMSIKLHNFHRIIIPCCNESLRVWWTLFGILRSNRIAMSDQPSKVGALPFPKVIYSLVDTLLIDLKWLMNVSSPLET